MLPYDETPAGLYTRKSQDQPGVSDDEKSVARQIEQGKAYARKKGWVVLDEHIYVDDAITGAEFEKRTGLMRLLGSLSPKPPFKVLIMNEGSRFGRESFETPYLLKKVLTAGVEVWDYLADRQLTFDSPFEKFMLQAAAFADDIERWRAQQRTFDALLRKAMAGYVAGGRRFGYDNVEVLSSILGPDGQPKRSHVELKINDKEAPVVVEIFQYCAAGKGYTSIAKLLKEEGAPCPRPNPGRPRAWAPLSVREILFRRLYRAEMVWNQTKKRNTWGTREQRPRPEKDWITIPVPHLRIVSDELWERAHKRLADTQANYITATKGQPGGRSVSGVESKYLLTGLTQCAICGGSLVVRRRGLKSGRIFTYVCGSHYLRGPVACTNNLVVTMVAADEAVLKACEQDILQQKVVERAIEKAIARLKPAEADSAKQRGDLKARLNRLDTELANLATGIASGGQLSSLLAAIKEREAQRERLHEELRLVSKPAAVSAFNPRAVKRELCSRLAEWQGLLRREPQQARLILKKLRRGNWSLRRMRMRRGGTTSSREKAP